MWIGVAAMLFGSVVVAEVGRRSLAGRLRRSHLVGIRTRATLASDEAWDAAHRAGGRTMVVAGLASTALTVVAGLAGVASAEDAAIALLLVMAAVVLACGAIMAGQRGDAAAKEATQHRG